MDDDTRGCLTFMKYFGVIAAFSTVFWIFGGPLAGIGFFIIIGAYEIWRWVTDRDEWATENTEEEDYPEPTAQEPPQELLDLWLADGVCEATDGCFPVEPAGMCDHGHVSWLVHQGMFPLIE